MNEPETDKRPNCADMRAAFQCSPQPIICLDMEGRVTKWNPAAEELFGWSKAEVLGKPNPMVREEDQAAFRKELERQLRVGGTDNLPVRCVTKRGEVIEAVLTSSPIRDADGEPRGFVGIITDLTERLRAQERLQASETRYRELFEFMGDGVAVYEAVDDGANFVFKEFNRAGERIEGISRDAVIGRSVTEVFPGVDEFGLLEVLRRVFRTGRPEHFPESFYQDDRICGWWESYVYKLPSGEIVAVYEDVTARQRARLALQASEERFRSLIESTTDWIWEIDVEGVFTYTSPQVTDILGYDPEEILGSTPFDYITRESAERARGLLERFAESPGSVHHMEFEAIHKEGRPVFIDVSGTSVVDPRGTFRGFRGLSHDVTARRRIQQKLQANLALVQTLLDTIPLPVFYKDTDLVYQGCNSAFAWNIVGLPKEQIVGRSLFDLNPRIPPDLIERYGEQDREIFEKGTPQFYEAQAKTANGERREFLFSKAVYRDAQGTPAGLIGVMTDLTQRKRHEDALRQSEQRFRSLYQSVHAGVFVQRADLNITEANPLALELLELAREENGATLRADPDWRIVQENGSPIDPADVPWLETLRTGQPVRRKTLGLLTAKGRQPRWLAVNTQPVVDEQTGEVAEVIVTLQDVTDLKRAVQALRDKHAEIDQVFRSLPDAIVCVDLDRKIVRVNPAFTEVFGYEPEEVLGKQTRILYASEEEYEKLGRLRYNRQA
ncbi:MAG: PAS domain S-box protein, partial [Candidatus Latescibacteria bacterium]|nr:PAS domain S-box protein [Candidatus Latescibacterota bacterium]